MSRTSDIHAYKILILDFGSQYTQLIARRIREVGVFCEIYPYHMDKQFIQNYAANGIILSGGPETVTAEDIPRADDIVFELGVPVLGICYGMQTMAQQLGGKVESASHHEYGFAKVKNCGNTRLLSDIKDETNQAGENLLDVWMSHGDRLVEMPNDFICMASTDDTPIAAMANEKKSFYGIQFHPEVTHTTQGKEIFTRFLSDICQCQTLWNAHNIVEDSIERIRQQVGDDKVVLGLSGGVDSSVVAALLHQAIGDQLTCVFVDNGLLRLHEGDQVMDMFAKHMGVKVIRVDAEQQFLGKLKGIADPEQKRKIIGHEFIEVFDQQAGNIDNVKWLAQGTIYPDVIESGGKNGTAHVIKSHHNVGGLPEDMALELLEPLRELFKDEVRKIGLELGLPYDMVYRHPFPGPGLGVRILGEVKKEYADILRKADAIFIEELHRHNLYHNISQAFAVFLPVKSVGVKGDGRCYSYVISLRAVETIDFMTARWACIPYDVLEIISTRILNQVAEVTRVTYDISSKPPATIEWE